jgi:hypothetical protein
MVLAWVQTSAQSEIPKGFKKGTIELTNGMTDSGFIKENIRGNAAVVFLPQTGAGKKTYHGSDLAGAEIEGTKFLCIRGDFFKILCEGELFFLQKTSDASGKPTYNGNEAIFLSGTQGKINDYFIYTAASKELKLVSKKNLDEVIASSFGGFNAAIDRAKSANGDLSGLRDAVELYNHRDR